MPSLPASKLIEPFASAIDIEATPTSDVDELPLSLRSCATSNLPLMSIPLESKVTLVVVSSKILNWFPLTPIVKSLPVSVSDNTNAGAKPATFNILP